MPEEGKPSYLLMPEDELGERVNRARSMLSPCKVCPRNCEVDRLQNKFGVCKTGENAIVSSFNPHFGEEEPLVGRGGSGTIFFSHCNLKCIFCQNYEISHMGEGDEVDPGKISAIMLYLQKLGCENINFVSPTHVVPQILASLPKAMERGLRLPLVYNTGGYDSVETLRLLEGIVDIYMPDAKYSSPKTSKQLSGVDDYPQVNREALREMHRQVGDLELDERGVAKSGLLVRHLVLPGGLSGTDDVTSFIAREVSTNTYINVMDQYRPCYRAGELDLLDRRITGREYEEAVEAAKSNGLNRLDSRKRRLFFPL